MKAKAFAFIFLMLISAGCAELTTLLQTGGTAALTEADVINGLKEALITGAKNSATRLAAENGYYGDAAIKILLPDEAKTIVDNISKIPGGDKLVEDVIIKNKQGCRGCCKGGRSDFCEQRDTNDNIGCIQHT